MSGSRIVVGIATVGRPEVLARTLNYIHAQTRVPDAVIICAPGHGDIGELTDQGGVSAVSVIIGPRGLTRQRNAIFERCGPDDIVVFFDDDFVPARDYLANVAAVMERDREVIMTTGVVVGDGVCGEGLSFEAAEALLAADAESGARDGPLEDVANGYGCNMSVRMSALAAPDLRFDESLPLYGWLEDVDFGYRLAAHGRIVKAPATRGVHLGVKSGRQSGKRLGYSQIANPVYLARRGRCPWKRALFLMSRNIAANMARSIWPEPWIDRRGRLGGNLLALGDAMGGRLAPDRILSLQTEPK